MRRVLVFLVALAPFVVHAPATAASTVGAQPPAIPPWGIDAVTSPALTADRLTRALPSSFAGYQPRTNDAGAANAKPPTFALDAKIVRSFDPAGAEPSIPVAYAEVITLRPGLTPLAVLTGIVGSGNRPGFTLDQADLSPTSRVPYALFQDDVGDPVGRASFLDWGAAGGQWLFTMSAIKRDVLAALVSAVVANLTANAAPGSATAAAQVSIETTDPRQLVASLLSAPFLGNEQPDGVVIGEVVPAAANGNHRPAFVGTTLGAVAWLDVAATYPTSTLPFGIVSFQYGVFATPDEAQVAYRAIFDQDIAQAERYASPGLPGFTGSSAAWTAHGSLDVPLRPPCLGNTASAGVIAQAGNVLVVTALQAACTTDPTPVLTLASSLTWAGLAHLHRLAHAGIASSATHPSPFGMTPRVGPLTAGTVADWLRRPCEVSAGRTLGKVGHDDRALLARRGDNAAGRLSVRH